MYIDLLSHLHDTSPGCVYPSVFVRVLVRVCPMNCWSYNYVCSNLSSSNETLNSSTGTGLELPRLLRHRKKTALNSISRCLLHVITVRSFVPSFIHSFLSFLSELLFLSDSYPLFVPIFIPLFFISSFFLSCVLFFRTVVSSFLLSFVLSFLHSFAPFHFFFQPFFLSFPFPILFRSFSLRLISRSFFHFFFGSLLPFFFNYLIPYIGFYSCVCSFFRSFCRSFLHSLIHWFADSFIPDISIAPLQVHCCSEALPTQYGYCVGVNTLKRYRQL